MATLLARTPVLPSMLDDDGFGFPSNFLESDPWNFPTRMFNTPFFRNAAVPAVNIKDNANSYEVELAVPGYKKEDMKVNVEKGILTISSERKKETEEEKKGYTRKEFSYSSFQRSFQLPEHADGDNVKANYVDGVLKLSIPKVQAMPEKKGKEVKIG